MAKTYKLSFSTRLINWIFRVMTRLGVGASYRHILTVRGRRTQQLYSTPVDVMDFGGSRWLVAGYGPANWVRNALASGEVTLSRGGRSEGFTVDVASPQEAVPVLRKYMAAIRVTRPYIDATPDSSDEAVASEISKHPVLRLTPQT